MKTGLYILLEEDHLLITWASSRVAQRTPYSQTTKQRSECDARSRDYTWSRRVRTNLKFEATSRRKLTASQGRIRQRRSDTSVLGVQLTCLERTHVCLAQSVAECLQLHRMPCAMFVPVMLTCPHRIWSHHDMRGFQNQRIVEWISYLELSNLHRPTW